MMISNKKIQLKTKNENLEEMEIEWNKEDKNKINMINMIFILIEYLLNL